jgi:hypothetical protein
MLDIFRVGKSSLEQHSGSSPSDFTVSLERGGVLLGDEPERDHELWPDGLAC